MSDLQRVHVGKTAAMAGLALVVGLGVALPVTLYFQYDRGADQGDEWAFKNYPSRPFNSVVTLEQKINAQGRMAEATASPGPLGLGHFSRMTIDPKLLVPCLIGLGLLVLCTVARLRIPKWPLHPVFFLVWTVWNLKWVAPAFLLGWLAKVLVTKFGGAKVYHQVKPLMYGLIAGEALAAIIALIIGGIVYLVTGQPPKPFGVIDF
jgi:hypothetical protein